MPGPVRRLMMAALAAAALSMVVLFALIAAPVLRMSGCPFEPTLAATPGHGAPSSAKVLRLVERDLARPMAAALTRAAVGEAVAQTRLDFKPVPAESAEAFDQRVSTHRTVRVTGTLKTVPVPPAAPAEPAPVSEVPELPEPPTPSSTGNIVQIGSDIHIEKGQVVDGDVLSIGGDIRVDGHVRGNVSATRGDVTLGSTARVDRDVLCIGGTLQEEPGAYVGGQRVTGLEGRERLRERMRGRVEREIDLDEEATRHRANAVVRGLAYILFWLGIAWLVTHFAPARTGTALRSLQEEPGMALGYGFALILLLVPSVVALAFVVALLCITLVGIPVALGALIAYAGLLIILGGWGAIVGYAALGHRFAKGSGRPGGSLTTATLVGVLIVHGLLLMGHLLHLIPFMGGFGTLLRVLGIVGYAILALLGMGALLRSKFGQGPQGRWWPPQHLFRSIPTEPATAATAGGAAWWAPGGAPAPAPSPPAPVAPPLAPAPAPPPAPEAEAGPLSASTPPEPPPSPSPPPLP